MHLNCNIWAPRHSDNTTYSGYRVCRGIRGIVCVAKTQLPNLQRLRIAVQAYVETGGVPTPAEMSTLEPVLPRLPGFASISVGDSFGDAFYSSTEFKLSQVATRYESQNISISQLVWKIKSFLFTLLKERASCTSPYCNAMHVRCVDHFSHACMYFDSS